MHNALAFAFAFALSVTPYALRSKQSPRIFKKIRNYTKIFHRHEKLAVPMLDDICQSGNHWTAKTSTPFSRQKNPH
jgi:hypothetical protein